MTIRARRPEHRWFLHVGGSAALAPFIPPGPFTRQGKKSRPRAADPAGARADERRHERRARRRRGVFARTRRRPAAGSSEGARRRRRRPCVRALDESPKQESAGRDRRDRGRRKRERGATPARCRRGARREREGRDRGAPHAFTFAARTFLFATHLAGDAWRGKLTWLGHAAFRMDRPAANGSTSIRLDNPKCPENELEPERVDMIAITHGHGDHVGDVVELAEARPSGRRADRAEDLARMQGAETDDLARTRAARWTSTA